jgi:hypothetical protein
MLEVYRVDNCQLEKCFERLEASAIQSDKREFRRDIILVVTVFFCTICTIISVITCNTTIRSMTQSYFDYDYSYPEITQEQTVDTSVQKQEIGGKTE